jgi:hypothetical protein
VVWTPPNTAGRYTLTGARAAIAVLLAIPRAARHSTECHGVRDVPSALQCRESNKRREHNRDGSQRSRRGPVGNISKGAKGTDFTLTSAAGGGTFGVLTCSSGICTAIYTAPAAAGTDNITVTVTATGIQVLNSPVVMTISP